MIKNVKCFVCGKELKMPWYDEKDEQTTIQPLDDGLWFRSTGNYGSTIFDPMDEQYLEISICDKCILDKKDEVKHIHNIRRKSTSEANPFSPSDVKQ